MTTPTGPTYVHDPRGSTHTGSGNQYVVNWFSANERLVRTGTPRLHVVREHRRLLARCFVHPRFYGTAAERLRDPGGVVLIDGPPGSGRRAAATMLLEGTSTAANPIEELPVNGEEDALEASGDDRYLLDLSHVTDGDYPEAQRALIRYRSMVERCGARMVAVLPNGLDWMLNTELLAAVVRLERPQGKTVFLRYLRVSGIECTPEELNSRDLATMFITSPMRELARLADLVSQARASGQYGTEFSHWLAVALEAAMNWSEQVSQQLRDHRDVMARALLFTTAMVSGARAEAVLAGARCLLEHLRHELDGTPRLAQDDLGEQLAKLEITRGEDGRVSFARLAYDEAVRRHYWRNYPDLREAFRDWAGQCIQLPELGREDRMRLVARFAEQALDSDRPEDLCVLVEQWTRQPSGSRRLRAEAAAMLELGLSHDEHGARLRARVYGWATSAGLAPDLVHVLTDVCRQVMVVTHPDQALVRLRHLALRQSGAAGAAAAAALVQVARGNRRLMTRLINQLMRVTPLTGTATDVLLGLLEPGTRFRPPWQELTLAWRAVMVATTASDWSPVAQRWLTQAASGSNAVTGLNVLVIAAMADPALLTLLYAATREWAAAPPLDQPTEPQAGPYARLRVAEQLCRRIDVLQGVEAPGPGPDSHNPREGV
ncbi:hypothetical protein ACWDR0_15275 [Streptomyces sp. NPDC003691]